MPRPAAAAAGRPLGVLFVCLGNICRSPTAEAVFTNLVKQRGLADRFRIDSAGTIDYHEALWESCGLLPVQHMTGSGHGGDAAVAMLQGGPADGRMRAHAARRGIELTSISRPIRRSDFEDFDIILAMDQQNLGGLLQPLHGLLAHAAPGSARKS
eukprot:SM000033S12315  [mRNA]  locus=s33:8266:9107:- [translate_table: standard]